MGLVYIGVQGRRKNHHAAKFQFDIATIHRIRDWFHPHFFDLRASTKRCQEITMGTMQCQETTMGTMRCQEVTMGRQKLIICDDSIMGW